MSAKLNPFAAQSHVALLSPNYAMRSRPPVSCMARLDEMHQYACSPAGAPAGNQSLWDGKQQVFLTCREVAEDMDRSQAVAAIAAVTGVSGKRLGVANMPCEK